MEPSTPATDPRSPAVKQQLEQVRLVQNQLAMYARDLSRTYRELRDTQARLEESYLSTLSALAAAIEARDGYLKGHSSRVTACSQRIGIRMGLTPEQLESLRRAALLHDIGKIGTSDDTLRKPAALDPSERQEIRHHPVMSYQMLSGLSFLAEALPGIRHHHERYDGSGYPDGMEGESIPLIARILAVCDAYDAMTSDRPYRPSMPTKKAMDEIRRGSGSQFDPQIVQLFIETTAENE